MATLQEQNAAQLARARAAAAQRASAMGATAQPVKSIMPANTVAPKSSNTPRTSNTQPTRSVTDQSILDAQNAAYDKKTTSMSATKITAPAMVKTEPAPTTTPNTGNYDPLDYSIARKIVEQQYKNAGFTPQEIDSITTKYLGQSQTDSLAQQETSTNAMIKAQKDAIKEEEKRIAQEEQRLANQRQNKTNTYAGTLETKYDPMRTRAREQADQTTSVQERLLGARGSLTSSTGEQALGAIDQSLTDTINSIESAKAAEVMLYEAQLAGADAETIAGMRQNIDSRRAQADQFEMESLAALEQSKIQAAIDGDARTIEMLDQYSQMFTDNSLKKIDEKVTNLISDGFVYDEYGRRVTDGDGNEMTIDLTNALMGDPSNVQYVGAQYDQFGTLLQPAGYFDKKTRQFITIGAGGNASSGGIPVEGGSTGFSGAASGFSGENGMRTDRHNNPVAMTTDVARTLGLKEGVDYTKGDAFPNNPNLFTARLTGDGVATTIKALDIAANDPNKQAFYTQSNKPRWSYVAISDQDWLGKSNADKQAFIAQMYKNEGGNGSLISGISGGQTSSVSLGAPKSAEERNQRLAEGVQKGLSGDVLKAYIATGAEPGLASKDKQSLRESFAKSEQAKQLAGVVELNKTMTALKDYISKNDVAYLGKNQATLQSMSSDIAIAYKNAKALGALVGADWTLVDSYAPQFGFKDAVSRVKKGQGKESILAGLNAGLKANAQDYSQYKDTLNVLYPDVANEILAAPVYKMSTTKAVSTRKVRQFSVGGVKYQTRPMTDAEYEAIKLTAGNKAARDKMIATNTITLR